MESATENIPPCSTWYRVRVKKRGKSSLLSLVTGKVGKPHLEQGQIGKRLRMARPMLPGSAA